VCKASEDVGLGARVIVLLGFYQGGVRDGGHFVTVAGANSTTHQLLLSNPIRDDFEAGRTSGRSPAWHPYPHSSTVHNNASLVSHDAYAVRYNSIIGCWFLEGYFDDQTWEARIEYDVITSPYELLPYIVVRNLAICCGQTHIPQNRTRPINVKVTNEGPTNETFKLTVYWNNTNVIGTTSVSLLIGETKIVQFSWFANQTRYLNYTISAVATPVLGEVDTADNTFVGDTVTIVWLGDVDADKEVTILDIVRITGIYASKYPQSLYNPNSDLDCDGEITILDVVICTGNYAYKEP